MAAITASRITERSVDEVSGDSVEPSKNTTTPRAEFQAGLRASIPLILGSIPFGIIFGATAVTQGISPLAIMALSLLVFAGSAQFIAVGLLVLGAPVPLIILTTFIVNLRHMLYSLTLGTSLKGLSRRWLIPLAFWLTDETFAVTVLHYQASRSPYKHFFQLGSSLSMYIDWNLWTLVGVIAGGSIPNAAQWGLDYAEVVTFTGIVIGGLRAAPKFRPALICILTAGVVAVLTNGLPNKLGLLIATFCGILAGIIAETLFASPTTASPTMEQR